MATVTYPLAVAMSLGILCASDMPVMRCAPLVHSMLLDRTIELKCFWNRILWCPCVVSLTKLCTPCTVRSLARTGGRGLCVLGVLACTACAAPPGLSTFLLTRDCLRSDTSQPRLCLSKGVLRPMLGSLTPINTMLPITCAKKSRGETEKKIHETHLWMFMKFPLPPL